MVNENCKKNGERSTRAAPGARIYSGFIVADLSASKIMKELRATYWTL